MYIPYFCPMPQSSSSSVGMSIQLEFQVVFLLLCSLLLMIKRREMST